jgi:Mrp family chromosome partitioning ATPase
MLENRNYSFPFTAEELRKLLNLPNEEAYEWGYLPEGIFPSVSKATREAVRREIQATYSLGEDTARKLITYGHPKSMLSEAYRNIRTSLLLSFPEKPPKKIIITSPNPAEGKTTTVINTAIALAQTGAQIIVIDSDMRKPRVHKVFNEENGEGLSNFLSGNAELGSVIKKTEIPNLFYIPSGPIPPNPSELIGSKLFKK